MHPTLENLQNIAQMIGNGDLLGKTLLESIVKPYFEIRFKGKNPIGVINKSPQNERSALAIMLMLVKQNEL
jgi:hypothetical protein